MTHTPETGAQSATHVARVLELARHLDGTRTIVEAGRAAGLATDTLAYRVFRSIRAVAERNPHLMALETEQDGRRSLHRVTLYPAPKRRPRAKPKAKPKAPRKPRAPRKK